MSHPENQNSKLSSLSPQNQLSGVSWITCFYLRNLQPVQVLHQLLKCLFGSQLKPCIPDGLSGLSRLFYESVRLLIRLGHGLMDL